MYENLNLVRDANVVKQHYAFHVEAFVDYKAAVTLLRQTASEFEEIGEHGLSVYTLSRAAVICNQNDDVAEAEICMQEAAVHRERMENDDPFMLGYFYRAKAELNFRLSKYQECLLDSEKSSQLCDIMGMYAESGESLRISAKVHEVSGDFQKAYEVSDRVIDLMSKAHRRNDK